MRIAVTYENGQIFQHFGHTETFKIYDIEEGKVVHSEVVDTNGNGHGALAGILNALNADVLICGGIGGGAQTALAAAGINLFGGVSGDADKAVEAFINETLEYNPDGLIIFFLCLSKVMDGMYNIVNDPEIFILETA